LRLFSLSIISRAAFYAITFAGIAAFAADGTPRLPRAFGRRDIDLFTMAVSC
jgi:hypothetical protein